MSDLTTEFAANAAIPRAKPLDSYKPFWAKRFGTAKFLPTSRAEMDAIAPTIARAAAQNQAQALFLTGNHAEALPEITAALADKYVPDADRPH